MRFCVALFVVAVTSMCQSALGCPTCKESLHVNGVATGYAISILLMMVMPFLIVTLWALAIYRLRKPMKGQQHRAAVVLPSEQPV
jgi:uncharacterized membrane protein